jgi:glycerophosphoryl diester phosphodiesterase
MHLAVSLGVDAIITDEAATLMHLLGRGGPGSLESTG